MPPPAPKMSTARQPVRGQPAAVHFAGQPVTNQFALLGKRRFLPLFMTQFLGAFNDQVYQKAFVALVTYRLAEKAGIPVALLGVIASGLFILPFAVVTPTAGQIGDRVDKAVMMRWIKAWEIVVMGLAVVGFYTQSIVFLYFVLFLMGAQSAMFAPIKYSVIPQYLHRDELMGGNGLVQASTFLAIIVGTILGNELILREQGELIDLYLVSFRMPIDGVALISAAVVGIAVCGLVASLFAPSAPPSEAHGPVDWVFPRAIWNLLKMVFRNPPALKTILSISWFWFLGATFLSLLPAYAKVTLGVDEGVLTVLLAGFSIGVAVGAVASEWLSHGEVSVRVPPVGALGISLMAIELWFATPGVPFGVEGALVDRTAFFGQAAGWRILADFVLLAAFAGLYVTPLNAMLQALAPDRSRASYIAAANVIDFELHRAVGGGRRHHGGARHPDRQRAGAADPDRAADVVPCRPLRAGKCARPPGARRLAALHDPWPAPHAEATMSKRRRAKGMRRGQGAAPAAGGGAPRHPRGATPAPRPPALEARAARRAPAADPALRPRFWESVPLAEMTAPEWEALCDGCGKCCLLKLEDADTGRVHYTDVTCRLFDCATRSCGQYTLRRMFVPGCVVLAPDNLDDAAGWMPASCAYRRLHEGRGLADWHPLVSGDPASVARAGQALTRRTVPEYEVSEDDLEDHVLDEDLLNDDGEDA